MTTPTARDSNNIRYTFDANELKRFNLPSDVQRGLQELNDLINIYWGPEEVRTVVSVILSVVCILVLVAVIFGILHFVSKTALIRMVDAHEGSGEKVGFRQGFRTGWSKEAWRLFLLSLLVILTVFLLVIVLLGCSVIPVLLTSFSGKLATWSGIVATIGLFFLMILLIMILMVVLSLFLEMIYRVIVLQKTGVWEGIQLGLQLVRRNIKDVFLMWLVLVGLQIGFAILLIPLIFLLLGIAALVGGGAGYGMYQLASTMWSTGAGWVSAITTGLVLFFLVIGIPLAFLVGLKEVYVSTVWTLTYRTLVLPAELTSPASSVESPEVEA